MFDIEFVLVGSVDLEHAVPAVIGVACDNIVLGLALVENKLVQERLLCVWRCFSEDAFLRVRHGEGWCGRWCG